MRQLFGIIDCNNFYVSCERVFQPVLEGKPVVVLSNNDGNIIARSNEAKRLGITMGMAFFKARRLIESHDVKWFSSNYALYGDMSRRVMDTINQLVPATEHYSIDEAFVHFDAGHQDEDAHHIKQTIRKWTGIPISVGIGPTKVLAKVANTIAKRNPEYDGVVDLSGAEADDYLKDFPIGDLWGIGRQSEKFLKSEEESSQPDLWEAAALPRLIRKQKIETALELKHCADDWIRKHLTIRGLRLLWELRGISCLPLEAFEKPRKGLCCSRSFGRPVFTLPELCEAVVMHATRGAEKLRRRHLAASHLTIFISTSSFKQNPDEMYSASASWQLPFPTSYPAGLAQAAQALVARVYKAGFSYHKAGVFLTDIVRDTQRQQSLLVPLETERQVRLMEAVDQLNKRYGRHTLRPLSMGFEQGWNMRRERVSGRYTTQLDEVLKARV
jgi:Nucleotidyltransferase/DNA polymerase involved in DNA repair